MMAGYLSVVWAKCSPDSPAKIAKAVADAREEQRNEILMPMVSVAAAPPNVTGEPSDDD